ncbi:hypothetical protein QQS21_010743 [Conoideocrella luteorostrata]|uniref:Deoxyribonuclease NucA/NucB domain-containing protein n=1 Tax=Conoideocrella luteorostrata TaxID=1105319 RepID=A0AAJ0CGS0_9HYPO|nr:hypothetical protein QQS21_010743 [Conoideocrella luteorostrata]
MRTFIFTAVALLVSSAAAKEVKYDCKETPEICLNTCWAIKCQRNTPNLHGGGQKNAAASKKYGLDNRNKWGYSKKPCAIGKGKFGRKGATSPDEYPYASSKEGGLGTFSKKVALRCVPKLEQSKQGGKVSGIGTDKKSKVWKTTWTNYSHLPQNWCGRKPSCKNDGKQFVSAGPNGPWTLAKNGKKVRDIASYSEDGETSWVETRDIPDDAILPEEYQLDDNEIEAREADDVADEDNEIEARDADDVADEDNEIEARDADDFAEDNEEIVAREADDVTDDDNEIEAREADDVAEEDNEIEAREADDIDADAVLES